MSIELNQLYLRKVLNDLEKREKEHPYRVKLRDMWINTKNYIESIPRRIKSFIQRGIRGWADSDTWEFDTYLAKVISGGVKHLRDNKTGFPLMGKNMSEEQSRKEWKNILNKIIKTFKTAEKISNGDIFYISPEEYDKGGYIEMVKEIARDVVLTKQESIEYEEGFDLFKKYFHNLWD